MSENTTGQAAVERSIREYTETVGRYLTDKVLERRVGETISSIKSVIRYFITCRRLVLEASRIVSEGTDVEERILALGSPSSEFSQQLRLVIDLYRSLFLFPGTNNAIDAIDANSVEENSERVMRKLDEILDVEARRAVLQLEEMQISIDRDGIGTDTWAVEMYFGSRLDVASCKNAFMSLRGCLTNLIDMIRKSLYADDLPSNLKLRIGAIGGLCRYIQEQIRIDSTKIKEMHKNGELLEQYEAFHANELEWFSHFILNWPEVPFIQLVNEFGMAVHGKLLNIIRERLSATRESAENRVKTVKRHRRNHRRNHRRTSKRRRH